METQDLLLTRADKGKDARLFVFRLSAIGKVVEERQVARTKADCKDNKLEKTKGCYLYAINTHHGSELRIVVAIRNKLLLITKKSPVRPDSLGQPPPAWPQSPVEEFQYIREICLSDPPVVMTLVDGPTRENDNLICVAYRHQFDLVNESTGESYRLHHVDASKVNFVAAVDLYEDGEAGLLLCYNCKSSLSQRSASPLVSSPTLWNSVPEPLCLALLPRLLQGAHLKTFLFNRCLWSSSPLHLS
uniref:CNH domain-containing protein n=1 Tax=Callorhinchus milii TaxID=7868 RepID=A0A4W3GZS3_CALMI